MVGVAGKLSLFKEFQRKLPDLVAEKKRKIDSENFKTLMANGIPKEEAYGLVYNKEHYFSPYPQPTYLNHLQPLEAKSIGVVSVPAITKPLQASASAFAISALPSPQQLPTLVDSEKLMTYKYTSENLLDDSKALIQRLNSRPTAYPLEALIGLNDEHKQPSLHYIDPYGGEQEIEEDYFAIGSGAPYVKMFFDRYYDAHKSLGELIQLSYLALVYAKEIALEDSVGWNKKYPPEVVAVYEGISESTRIIFRFDTSQKGKYVYADDLLRHLSKLLNKNFGDLEKAFKSLKLK